jgi:tetratricopeptide (TPR) repeat protein
VHDAVRRVVALIVVGCLAFSASTFAATTAPVADDVVARTDAEIRFWQSRVDRDPADHLSPTKLGVLCLRQGRRTGDVTLFAKSEDALRTALKRGPKHLPALVALSSACLARHKFTDALAAARAAYAVDNSDPESIGTLGDALLETGDIAGSEVQYTRLAKSLPGLYAFGRLANLKIAKADANGAFDDYQRAIDAGEREGAAAEDLAWCHVQRGGVYFARGDWDHADSEYAAALKLVPDSYAALDRVAELHAARGEFDRAENIYRDLLKRVARPELMQALGDVCTAAGRPADAVRHYDDAQAKYRASADAGELHYAHHLAGFYCDARPNGAEAVRWAEKDLAQRRTAASLDGVAWARYANHDFAGAAKAADELFKQFETCDSHVLYHASLIYGRAGDQTRSAAFLRRAAAANPRFMSFHVHR